ncbi:MAG: hypothetical protein ACE5FL_00480, partial [Myxococcota bacterium]
LRLTPGTVWLTSLWIPVFGALAVALVGPRDVRRTFLRFALASAAALILHVVAVDWLNLRSALQVSPQRATVSFAALSIAAVGLWIAESMRVVDPLRRCLAAAFLLAAVLFRDPSIAALFGALLAIAWALRDAAIPAAARRALAALAVVGTLASIWPSLAGSFHFGPERLTGRWARLRALGLDEDWVAVQEHIRRHSRIGDVVMAPPALSPRVFALRPSALRVKMQSFTHVSRPFAFAFIDWRDRVDAPMQSAGTAEAVAIARGAGADWLVLDDRDKPTRPGDPAPTHRAGPYRAFELSPARAAPALGRRSAEGAE